MVIAELGRVERYIPGLLVKEKDFAKKEREYYTHQGVKKAVEYIDSQYGANSATDKNRDSRLFYHSKWHTEGFIARAEAIFDAVEKVDPNSLGATKEEREEARDVLRLAGAFHDTIQISIVDPNQKPDASGMTPKKRLRATGENERQSAEAATLYMKKVNAVAGHIVYYDSFISSVNKAILLTDPTGGWTGKTISVPGFVNADILSQITQLADLGGTGMDGRNVGVYEALSLFAEENMDFRGDVDKIIYSTRRQQVLPSENRQEWYKTRLINWLSAQQNFIEGRRELILGAGNESMGKEINALKVSTDAKKAVKALFVEKNFAGSIEELEKLKIKYAKMPAFKDWAGRLMDSLVLPPASY
ncbi:MAG TPA: hypothetical protein VF189_03905 [Patescibacteria group bacterium]